MADLPENGSEELLVQDMAQLSRDPYGWVMYAFPWGKGELEGREGPNDWQRWALHKAGEYVRGEIDVAEFNDVLQIAVASGHGIGKSALVAWLILWGLSTMTDARVVLTANTKDQLNTKTWPELAKWHRLCVCQHWFRLESTSIHSTNTAHRKTWRGDALPWNEQRPESFAGLHNQGRRIIVIFDEASDIPPVIWETTEGALTDQDTEIMWFVFGNPTRNMGRFKECFGRYKHRWVRRQVDARDVPGTNKALFERWINDYGDDSDFVRVRIRGVFPRAGSMQLIPGPPVLAAMEAEGKCHLQDPVVLGVDVARFGDDESVILCRKGKDAKSFNDVGEKPWRFRSIDLMALAGKISEIALRDHVRADAIFVDETGVGGGVVDRLRQLGHNVIGVNFGARADGGSLAISSASGENYYNKAAEMWGTLRAWLQDGGCAIPALPELEEQLTNRQYGYNTRNQIQLEKKDDMKLRGLSSPDLADALALTFAYPVIGTTGGGHSGSQKAKSDWDPQESSRT